jgi:hypothetical protein
LGRCLVWGGFLFLFFPPTLFSNESRWFFAISFRTNWNGERGQNIYLIARKIHTPPSDARMILFWLIFGKKNMNWISLITFLSFNKENKGDYLAIIIIF